MKAPFNRSLTALLLMIASLTMLQRQVDCWAQQLPPMDRQHWENSEVFRINKMPPRSSGWSVANSNLAKQTKYDKIDRSDWIQSLNGKWDFRWSSSIADAQKNGLELADAPGPWDSIQVPGHMELQGYGTPIYVNIGYCFKAKPPYVSLEPDPKYTTFQERTPVGVYRRNFTLNPDWQTGNVYLHFAGVSSAFDLWVNGKYIGYSQGSRLPAEFDITKNLQPGDNQITCKVYRWCDGSYLEDQDMWRLSGLYRDVFVYHQSKTHLWDVYTDTDFGEIDGQQQGTLKLNATIRNSTDKKVNDLRLQVKLFDGDFDQPTIAEFSSDAHGVFENNWGEIQTAITPIDAIKPWSHEDPQLYSGIVTLVQGKKVLEARQFRIGFRRIELTESGVVLNGQPIKIYGVNRHEHDATHGNHMPAETMIQDLRLMKQANVNSVRCSHYPNDPKWYQLCDEYGILVMDEANIESHGVSYHTNVLPGDDPAWQNAAVDRMRSMVVRDRSHASVVFWSLGNEAGYGEAFRRMANVCRYLDSSKRPIQYADMNSVADFASRTYPRDDWLKDILAGVDPDEDKVGYTVAHGNSRIKKPYMMNEYAHAMGNSIGNLTDYWDLVHGNDRFVGGYIWDWVDQGLYKKMADGSQSMVYGGAFGDFPNDDNFCMNGVIQGDRVPHPHYYEVAHVYSPIKIKLADDRTGVVIENNFAWTNLDQFTAEAIVVTDQGTREAQALPAIDLAPGQSTQLTWAEIQSTVGQLAQDRETFVNFQFRYHRQPKWATADHCVAKSQVLFCPSPVKATGDSQPNKRDAKISKQNDTIELQWQDTDSKSWIATVNQTDGLMESLTCDGKSLIDGKVSPNFWRIPTDNDQGWKWETERAKWKTAPSELTVEQVSVSENQTTIKSVLVHAATKTRLEFVYSLNHDRRLQIDYTVGLPSDYGTPPRVGLAFESESPLNQVQWYGRGPHENYLDRKTSAQVGTYSADVRKWNHQYPRHPQESGHRSDVRWVRFLDSAGTGIKIQAVEQPVGLNAEMISSSQAQAGERTRILIDCLQMGVGGDTSWSLPVRPQYQLQPGTRYSMKITVDSLIP